MKKSFIAASLLAALASQAQAAPAVYQDGVLTISEGAVINDNGKGTYFKDIRFEPNANGTWRFAGGSERPLVHIDDITVVSAATVPPTVEVSVEGYKSVPCVELEPIATSRSGNTFYVVIAETVMGPAESCIAVIAPFTETFELDLEDAKPGAYTLNVNGMETEFDLLTP